MESLENKISKIKTLILENEVVLTSLKTKYDEDVKLVKENNKKEVKILKKLEQLQEKINEVYSIADPEEKEEEDYLGYPIGLERE